MLTSSETPPFQWLFGRVGQEGFSWVLHKLADLPLLGELWGKEAATAELLWIGLVLDGEGTLQWKRNQTVLHQGILLGGRMGAEAKEIKISGAGDGKLLSLGLAKNALHRLRGALGDAVLPKTLLGSLGGKLPGLVVVDGRLLGFDLLRWSHEISHPPGPSFTQPLFYQAKALEALSFLAGGVRAGGESQPTSRREVMAKERVAKAQALMAENLAEPLNLEEISRKVGCSSYYLSRTFSTHAGCTLQEYQRRIRLHHAADLLRSGKYNVTEAALSVGYNSLSHFTKAFRETFGCCPGLYPVRAGGGAWR